MTKTTQLAPYERQEGEGDERWQAFVIYREQPENGIPRRSLAKLARELGKSKQLVERWSSDDGWLGRVAAYDREQDAIRRSAQETELRRIVARQGTSLSAAAQALLVPINAYLKRVTELRAAGQDPYDGASIAWLAKEAREAARLIPQLVQAERLVHGLSTSNVGGHEGGPIDVRVEDARRRARGMTTEELVQLMAGGPAAN